jgi:energy-converting hydrogenase B subunit Q
MEPEPERCAMRIIAENRKGVLRDITTVIAAHEANIVMISQELFDSGPYAGMGELYFEYEPGPDGDREKLIAELNDIPSVHDVRAYRPFGDIFGSRVIIIGGGAQVAQVALGTYLGRHDPACRGAGARPCR